MTAQHADRQAYDDSPVRYVLTRHGEAATRELLTTDEAAALMGLCAAHVTHLAGRGRIKGVRVDRRWLLDAASVRSYVPQKPRPRGPGRAAPSVSAEPFLRLLDGRGGAAACGVRRHSAEEKAIERARRSGRLTISMADRLSIDVLGLTPMEIWGWDRDQ